MGEVLHEVDFNQLRIENQQYLEKIDERNQDLLRLKQMAGTTIQVLNSYKVWQQWSVKFFNVSLNLNCFGILNVYPQNKFDFILYVQLFNFPDFIVFISFRWLQVS